MHGFVCGKCLFWLFDECFYACKELSCLIWYAFFDDGNSKKNENNSSVCSVEKYSFVLCDRNIKDEIKSKERKDKHGDAKNKPKDNAF